MLSFPEVPHLLQCISNSSYYGKTRAPGKVICLKTADCQAAAERYAVPRFKQ
jgi:hypothetical protein